ncbi:FtsX-like permease family protein [Hamadaea tsunoensis]|uniref:FtsX-like permease family protein n=1 Tax=Hamadaea tsunoensis TaxID=53368 RepID=UPI00048877E6|nr:ABC transporter permease [Hamadaea tsunoensis]
MFIALRDLRFARGRFALLSAVVAVMTLMVVLLTGLTAGLGAAAVSAVDALPADRIAFAAPPPGQDVSFATSSLPFPPAGATAAAEPLGVGTSRLDAGSRSVAVTVLGGRLVPPLVRGSADGLVASDSLDLDVGTAVSVGGVPVTVTGTVRETSLSHLAAVYVPLAVWQQVAHTDRVTAYALPAASADLPGTVTLTRSEARQAVPGYASEQGSLTLMRVLLLIVSALVCGAFFTVWTLQRGHDLAVVRALGAGRAYLLRDAVGQALVVLLGGVLAGAGVAAGLGALARTAVPFVLDPSTVLLPGAAMLAVGLIGAAVPVRRVTAADPLLALGGAR